MLTDSFKTSAAFSPAASRKPLAGTGNPGGKVGTPFPASHVNSPIGHRYPLAGQPRMTIPPLPGSRARIHLCSRQHREAHPPAALTWPPGPARLPTPAPPGSRGFRVCAKRRGGAPARAASSAPASRPRGSPRLLLARCSPPRVPSLSTEQVRHWRPRLDGRKHCPRQGTSGTCGSNETAGLQGERAAPLPRAGNRRLNKGTSPGDQNFRVLSGGVELDDL